MKTNYDNLHSMTPEELAEFLTGIFSHDIAPWEDWFATTYCDKCESIELTREEYHAIFGCSFYAPKTNCSYCEVKGTCRYFPDMSAVPDNKDTIRMWLEFEVDKEGAVVLDEAI